MMECLKLYTSMTTKTELRTCYLTCLMAITQYSSVSNQKQMGSTLTWFWQYQRKMKMVIIKQTSTTHSNQDGTRIAM